MSVLTTLRAGHGVGAFLVSCLECFGIAILDSITMFTGAGIY